MFSNKPNYLKLRTNLRLCINRLKLLEKKKTELALKARKEIADYIGAGKDDRARIRVEHIIREDYLVEAMEIVEMLCDLILARFGLVEKMNEMDAGIEEAVATIIWVTPRMSADIQELQQVSHQLALKYGIEYATACRRNDLEKVHEKVIHKMSAAAPPKILVENYMIEIARCYKVPFEPDPVVMMGEPPAVNNLIDLNIDSFSTNGGAGGGSGGGASFTPAPNHQPSNNLMSASAPSDLRRDLTAAERKHLEANEGRTNEYDNRRPPSPPGGHGGGGGGMAAWGGAAPYAGAGGGSNGEPVGGYAQNLQGFVPGPTEPQLGGAYPGYSGYPVAAPFGAPPLPSRPPNSNQSSPENAQQGRGGGAQGQQQEGDDGKNAWGQQLSCFDEDNDEHLSSLPPYDCVMNSPNQYPPVDSPQHPLGPPKPSRAPQPVPTPRGGPAPQAGGSVLPNVPTFPEIPGLPSVPVNSVGAGSVAGGDDVNFDDLTRRFEELKRRK